MVCLMSRSADALPTKRLSFPFRFLVFCIPHASNLLSLPVIAVRMLSPFVRLLSLRSVTMRQMDNPVCSSDGDWRHVGAISVVGV